MVGVASGGLSFEEGRSILEGQVFDYLEVPISSLQVDVSGEGSFIQVEGKGLELLKQAQNDLKYHCGISPRLFSEYADNTMLVRSMLDYSLNKRTGSVRVVHDNFNVVSIKPSEVPYNDPLEVYDTVSEVLSGKGEYLSTEMDGDHGACNMRFLTHRSDAPAKDVGDLSYCGVSVSVNGSVQVSPYVYRLVCSNGLTTDALASKTRDIKKEGQSAVTDKLIRTQVDNSYKLLESFTALDEKPVSNPIAYTVKLAKELGLSTKMYKTILERVESNSSDIKTMYDLVNIVTAMGVEFEDPRFDRVGGHFTEALSSSRCVTCSSKL